MKKKIKALKEKLGGEADAVDILKKDHRKVEKLFKQFQRLVEDDVPHSEKSALVKKACAELIVHTKIEEEIFYPAVRAAIEDDALMDEAEVEHEAAKDLIHQLLDMMPGEDHYDAKFIVLSEQVRHHIKEEEGEMFPAARKSGIDLAGLGRQMEERKLELRAQIGIGENDFGEINLTGAHAKAVLTREGLLP
jgi:hemerythrin-like domain-containing protein